jgi:hypothetical protein
MNSLKNQKIVDTDRAIGIKITSDLTNLTTTILVFTVQMFFECTLFRFVSFVMHKISELKQIQNKIVSTKWD